MSMPVGGPGQRRYMLFPGRKSRTGGFPEWKTLRGILEMSDQGLEAAAEITYALDGLKVAINDYIFIESASGGDIAFTRIRVRVDAKHNKILAAQRRPTYLCARVHEFVSMNLDQFFQLAFFRTEDMSLFQYLEFAPVGQPTMSLSKYEVN